MSNHRPPTDPGPSVASIVTGAALTLSALGAALFILWGPMDSRGLTGAGLGLVLAIVLLAQTVFRASERQAAQDRIRRWEARQQDQAERVARMTRPVFQEPDPLLVDHWASGGERPTGYSPEPVAVVLGTPEPEPWASDETQVFRTGAGDTVDTGERPDYLIQAAEATLAAREVGDQTREIDPTPYRSGQVTGPSAAALRPIAVPVFRTEVERDAWAHRYDLPTEVIPLQPEGWPES